MGKTLVIYNTTTAKGLVAAYIAADYGRQLGSVSFMNVTGVLTDTISTNITSLTAGTYSNIFVECYITTAGTGVLSQDQVALLNAALVTANQGPVIRTGTCQANATATDIVLDAGASSVDDFYTGNYIVAVGGSATLIQSARYITGYTGSTQTCTVTSTSTAITSTSTFTVFSLSSNIYLTGSGNATTGENAACNTWDALYPNVTKPSLPILADGVYQYAVDMGTAQAGGANTITLAASNALGAIASTGNRTTANYFAGMYVYIYGGTGTGQWGKVLSNAASTLVLTMTANWVTNPDNTSTYVVVTNQGDLFAAQAMQNFVLKYLSDPTVGKNQNIIQQMLYIGNNPLSIGKGNTQFNAKLVDEIIRLGCSALEVNDINLVLWDNFKF